STNAPRTQPVGRPAVSVVIATYARPKTLAGCLEALCAQTLPGDAFEVIVCDDGSPEPVAPSVARFHDRLALTVVRKQQAGPAAARNEGARQASGRLLAF